MPLDTYTTHLAFFFVGTMLIHSAQCVLNDVCDIEFDHLVGAAFQRPVGLDGYSPAPFYPERTKSRPLPSGRATVRGAVAFLLALALPALYLLSYANSTTYVTAASEPTSAFARASLTAERAQAPPFSYRHLPHPRALPAHEAVDILATSLAR